MHRNIAAFGVALCATVAACGGDNGYGSGPAPMPDPVVTAATVRATPSIQFTPATVTLAAGGTITFAFESVPHNVYFDNAPPGAPANVTTPSTNTTITRTFAAKGTFAYNCHLHPGMSGTVIVQ